MFVLFDMWCRWFHLLTNLVRGLQKQRNTSGWMIINTLEMCWPNSRLPKIVIKERFCSANLHLKSAYFENQTKRLQIQCLYSCHMFRCGFFSSFLDDVFMDIWELLVVIIKLFFLQLQHDYILGNYPVGRDDAATLSALQIFVEIGYVNSPESSMLVFFSIFVVTDNMVMFPNCTYFTLLSLEQWLDNTSRKIST